MMSMDDDDTLCYCFHISRRKIVNYVRRERPARASMITDCFGAGSGCGWCIPYLERYFAQSKEDSDSPDALTPDEYARQRGEYISAGHGVPPPGAIPPPAADESA